MATYTTLPCSTTLFFMVYAVRKIVGTTQH